MRNNHKTIGLVVLALIFTNSLSVLAEEDSSIVFSIHGSTNTSTDTPAEVILIDSQGRRTGFDATAPFNDASGITEVHEIPGSGYSLAGIGDESGGPDDEPYYRELYVPEPLQGKYTLQIIGRQPGNYILYGDFYDSNHNGRQYTTSGFITAAQTVTIDVEYSPSPGAPAPVITKIITFDSLRNDVTVAKQLNQVGDDKFVRSLNKNIDLAEKLYAVCDKRKHRKDKPCRPAIAVLKLFIKRLELANRKCDNPADCDEELEWTAFRKEYGRDDDYKDFFRDWDRDDWHKHKKQCKRFVTDEALKIIKDDAGWLINSLGGEIDKGHNEHHGNGKKGR